MSQLDVHAIWPAGGSAAPLQRERVATRCVCCGSAHLEGAPAVLMPFLAHRVFGWEPVVIDESWNLRTIPSGHAYSICRSLHCPDCGHLFLDIRFDDVEMQRLYEGYRGEAYTALRQRYEPDYGRRNVVYGGIIPWLQDVEAFLDPYLPSAPRVLDWGGDTGKNTPFRSRCSAHFVYDISHIPLVEGARQVTREEAVQVAPDLVICSNVLEHVPYPHELLAEIALVMSRDAIFYVEVPFEDLMREDGPAPHGRKKHWHEHINFFSEQSLVRVLNASGFEVLAKQVLCTAFDGRDVFQLQLACRLAQSGER